ncbi:hypothetical protein TcasGA2_TC013463 [Tribolium castaneum]|uniref:Uncharacterized protein n=1 Tax=Tribolium castaneum TaxID=7070 RepID=D6WLC9_TRICA|nr:PREDICTED: uncharacterized protein LOC107398032 [Tribolium castaneum]EFA03467.2 hypothetical protein TcasGA2_TC013463 [Tribolium castaneum]|eukprot:XP_015836182.1 PREDICTED: uncharacterized protein LOC107398032 [Tribolium castaneum]
MGFWANKTPFQTAMILVLLVAVPFFIAMLVTYITFGLVLTESERCEALCCALSTKVKTKNEILEEKKEQHGLYAGSDDDSKDDRRPEYNPDSKKATEEPEEAEDSSESTTCQSENESENKNLTVNETIVANTKTSKVEAVVSSSAHKKRDLTLKQIQQQEDSDDRRKR